MKLFDYKFLILLGLTLVVYFMFREIMDLRNKVTTLENNLEDVNKKVIEYKPKINNKKVTEISEKEEKPALFQIPLPKLPEENVVKKSEKKVVPTNTQQIIVTKEKSISEEELVLLQEASRKLSTIEETLQQSETESEVNSDNIEHLEIYSNDNEEDILENFSLDESSEIKTEDIIIDSEKKKIVLVKSEGDDELKESNSVTSEFSIPSDLNSVELNQKCYNYNDLMRNKLNELQCIAESLKIDLTNDGKKKTKSELSKDIIKVGNITQENTV